MRRRCLRVSGGERFPPLPVLPETMPKEEKILSVFVDESGTFRYPDAYGAGECRATASQLRRSKSVRMFNAGVEKVGALAETSDESELKNSTLLCSLRGTVRHRSRAFVVARSAKSLAGFSSLFPARGELFCCLPGPVPTGS